MLWWGSTSRTIARALLLVLLTVVFVVPIVTIVVAAFATNWTSALPTALTATHLGDALSGGNVRSLWVSVQTAIIASVCSIVLGTAAAVSSKSAPGWLRGIGVAVFHVPVAVPSVAIGLGILIAFNEPPLILGGRSAIVVVTHTVLVLAFAYGNVDAALARIDPGLYRAAESLGASATSIFFTVTLPLLVPALGAAAGLSLALSMGELGATAMVYPPTWVTLPATIYALAERGDTLLAAACTLVLLVITASALVLLSRIRGKVALR